MSGPDGVTLPGSLVRAWSLPGRVRVAISRDAPPGEATADSAIGREWARQREENPRLHNGPILSVQALDPEAGEVLARRDSYQRLVVQPRVSTGVRLLAVTGVLVARDAGGQEHVLLGRRAPGVRMYGGLWEIGPSGGVGVPPAPVTELDTAALSAHLGDEASEEIGIEIPPGVPVAVVRDDAARSDDVCLRVEMGPLEGVANLAPASWEYTQVRWAPVRELAALDGAEGNGIIAASRVLMRVLGWV